MPSRKRDPLTLAEAPERFLTGYFSTAHRSERTFKAYSADLAQFVAFCGGHRRLVSLGPEPIEEWAAQLKTEKYAPASIQRKMVSLRVFFHFWLRRGVLDSSNPSSCERTTPLGPTDCPRQQAEHEPEPQQIDANHWARPKFRSAWLPEELRPFNPCPTELWVRSCSAKKVTWALVFAQRATRIIALNALTGPAGWLELAAPYP